MRAVLICLLLLSSPCAALEKQCLGNGAVFEDGNGNGRRDAGERGLAGIGVSDGERIVVTDASGEYAFPSASGRTVFVIKPAGYRAVLRDDGLPDTWLNVQLQPGPTLRYGGIPVSPQPCRDFPLRREIADANAPLKVLVFGDPQPKTLLDVDYFDRDIVAPLVGRQAGQLGLSLGDISSDDLSLYPALKAVNARLQLPWLHLPGNHDLDFDAASDEASLDSYRHAFGPDTYAWEEHQANFILLDDVIFQPGAKPGYIGGFRAAQFQFLQAYLARADRRRLLVLAMHIPLFDTSKDAPTFRAADRERLFALLAPFPRVLVLSAHSHKQQHFFHGPATGWQGSTPLHEYNVGTTCGAYWSGVKDAAGIPASTMNDGTPNGYATLEVGASQARLRWHVARAKDDPQIGLHAPKVLRRGAYAAYGVYANVFMGQDDTPVEMRIDEGPWQAMRKVSQADPALIAENMRDDAAPALRGFDRSPEAVASTHLWRGVLPTNLAAGMHTVQVRATLADAGQVQAQTTYRLDDASN